MIMLWDQNWPEELDENMEDSLVKTIYHEIAHFARGYDEDRDVLTDEEETDALASQWFERYQEIQQALHELWFGEEE